MPEVDLLHLSVALGPLAVYFVLMGWVNLSRRPFVTTGARDTAALGVAISGFLAAGPVELFLPEPAAYRWGSYSWVLLLGLFSLCLTLIVLLMRPRIVIYNITPDQLRPLLADIVSELDREARWAGEALSLPQLGVHMYVEAAGVTRHAQLVSAGPRQDFAGWRRLELALSDALLATQVSRNPAGYVWLVSGLFIVTLVTFWIASDPVSVKQALRTMLRIY